MNIDREKLVRALRAEIEDLQAYARGADGHGRPSQWEREHIAVRTAEMDCWLSRIQAGCFDPEEIEL